jgi:signal peptidase I
MLGCLFELLETLLVTLLVFVAVQVFVAQPYEVQQESMENTLMPSQYVLVDKLTPHFDAYHRGDIVVFNPPAGWTIDPTGAPFVKRVIGIGGDTIDIHDGTVFVNGTKLAEPYLYPGQGTSPSGKVSQIWRVASGQLFVMGDHRAASQDSREFGPIETSTVIGRVWLRYWPVSAFGTLPQAGGSPIPSAAPSAGKPGS